MEAAGYIDVLRDRSSSLLDASRADLGAALPSCPGWTATDLVTHVGGVWGWAAATVRSGSRADFPSPPAGADLIGWAGDNALQLLDALEGADPATDCWTFGLPRSRLFWFRRQALETAVHAWDAQRAFGEPEPIGAEVASDGIDEFLEVMLPRFVGQNPDAWTGQSLHLHRTDGEGEWMVQLGPGATVSAERVHGKGDVALRGSASSLYLWIVNRIPTHDLEVFGDRAVADRWTSDIAF
jgi:uncharacterized protein (TIGR03083 family)